VGPAGGWPPAAVKGFTLLRRYWRYAFERLGERKYMILHSGRMFKRFVVSVVCLTYLFSFQVSAAMVSENWVPLRKTAEDCGALVEWDEAAYSATVTLGNAKVTIKPTDDVAVIVDNVMFVPRDLIIGLERTSLASTRNLKDLELDGFKKNEKFSFSVDFDSWGIINFTSGKFEGENNGSRIKYPAAFLVDNENNILYEFSNLCTTGTEIIDVLIKDLNEDGLKDVTITLAFFSYDTDEIYSDMPKLERIFYQIDNGLFIYS
jgi:hypothetical protein